MDNFSFLKDFPSSFIFGTATSSYQIEGNQYGGCGKSIWDDFAKRKLNKAVLRPPICKGPVGLGANLSLVLLDIIAKIRC